MASEIRRWKWLHVFLRNNVGLIVTSTTACWRCTEVRSQDYRASSHVIWLQTDQLQLVLEVRPIFFENLSCQELHGLLFNSVLSNIALSMKCCTENHWSIARHWPRVLALAARDLVKEHRPFYMLMSTLRGYYWYEPCAPSNPLKDRYSGEDLNVRDWRASILMIAGAAAKDSFTELDFQNIISYLLVWRDSEQNVDILTCLNFGTNLFRNSLVCLATLRRWNRWLACFSISTWRTTIPVYGLTSSQDHCQHSQVWFGQRNHSRPASRYWFALDLPKVCNQSL